MNCRNRHTLGQFLHKGYSCSRTCLYTFTEILVGKLESWTQTHPYSHPCTHGQSLAKKKACLIEDFGGFLKSDYGRSPLKKMSGRQMSSNRPPQTKKLCLNSYCVGWNPFLCISLLIMVQSSPRQRSNVHALWYALTHRVTHMLDKLCHVQITFSHSIVLTMEQQRSM